MVDLRNSDYICTVLYANSKQSSQQMLTLRCRFQINKQKDKREEG